MDNKNKNAEDFKNLQKLIMNDAITIPKHHSLTKELIENMKWEMYQQNCGIPEYVPLTKPKAKNDIDRAGNQFCCYCEAVYRGFKNN